MVGVYAYLRECNVLNVSKKGWSSEGVADMAVVRYSSTLSFGGFCLFAEDMATVLDDA